MCFMHTLLFIDPHEPPPASSLTSGMILLVYMCILCVCTAWCEKCFYTEGPNVGVPIVLGSTLSLLACTAWQHAGTGFFSSVLLALVSGRFCESATLFENAGSTLYPCPCNPAKSPCSSTLTLPCGQCHGRSRPDPWSIPHPVLNPAPLTRQPRGERGAVPEHDLIPFVQDLQQGLRHWHLQGSLGSGHHEGLCPGRSTLPQSHQVRVTRR